MFLKFVLWNDNDSQVECDMYNLSHANFNFESIIQVYQLSKSVLVHRIVQTLHFLKTFQLAQLRLVERSLLHVLFRREIRLQALLYLLPSYVLQPHFSVSGLSFLLQFILQIIVNRFTIICSTNDIDPNKVWICHIDFKTELVTPGTFLFAFKESKELVS